MVSKPLSAAIGWSAKADAERAGKEAAEAAMGRLPVSALPQAAVVFGSSWFDQAALIRGTRSILGEVPLAGCSTAGEITPQGPLTHSCALLLLSSERLTCSVGVGEAADERPREAGQQAAFAAVKAFRGTQRGGLLLFGDGLVSGYADVVRGLQEVLGTGALIAGGMAGDDLRFAQTYQYANRRVFSRSVVGLLLGQGAGLGVGIEHGFAPISKPRQITRARGNVLLELDRLPAASVYEEYFGRDQLQHIQQQRMTRQAVAYPLGMQSGQGSSWLLRNVIAFESNGSLTCSGEMLEGASLQLMIGSRQLALEAARRAAETAVRSLNRVAGVLVFDSVARRTLLGAQHATVELQEIRSAVGPSTPMIGCYTYGEQAVFGKGSVYERTAIQTGSVLVVALGTPS